MGLIMKKLILLMLVFILALPVFAEEVTETWIPFDEEGSRFIVTHYLVSHFDELNRFGFKASPMLPDNIKIGKFFNDTLSIYVWRFSYSDAEYQNRNFLYPVFGIYPPQHSLNLQEDLFEVSTRCNKNINEYTTTMRVITNDGSIFIECKRELPFQWEWYSP